MLPPGPAPRGARILPRVSLQSGAEGRRRVPHPVVPVGRPDGARPFASAGRRLVKAIESGVVHCLGHPLGRTIGKREPIAADIDEACRACVDNDVYVEINAQPDRLDLRDTCCKHAAEVGVKCTLGTNAHELADVEFMKYGVNVARRGWLGRKNILNTVIAKTRRKRPRKS